MSLIKIQTDDNSEQVISKKEFRIDGPEIIIVSPIEDSFFSGGDKVKIIWKRRGFNFRKKLVLI